jgi:hypothetical protein
MNKQTEALKMAIETNELLKSNLWVDRNTKKELDKVTNACREALEQPAPRMFLDLSNSNGNHPVEQPAQEPVARIKQGDDGYPKLVFNGKFKYESISIKQPDIPLYTHPASSWQGLSDDEMQSFMEVWGIGKMAIQDLEASFKEKNTP